MSHDCFDYTREFAQVGNRKLIVGRGDYRVGIRRTDFIGLKIFKVYKPYKNTCKAHCLDASQVLLDG